MALMDLKIDFAFKALFGSPGSEPILIAFLNAALKRSGGNAITSVDLLNPELGPRYLDDKKSILDIHARTEDGTRINIEIQLTNHGEVHTVLLVLHLFRPDAKGHGVLRTSTDGYDQHLEFPLRESNRSVSYNVSFV